MTCVTFDVGVDAVSVGARRRAAHEHVAASPDASRPASQKSMLARPVETAATFGGADLIDVLLAGLPGSSGREGTTDNRRLEEHHERRRTQEAHDRIT